MKVTLYSETEPRVYLEISSEFCGVADIDKHIRTMQKAKAWLIHERKVKRQREAAAQPKQAQTVK